MCQDVCVETKRGLKARGFKPKEFKSIFQDQEGFNKVFRYHVSRCVRMCHDRGRQDREDREGFIYFIMVYLTMRQNRFNGFQGPPYSLTFPKNA